jgi:hypothetical protein
MDTTLVQITGSKLETYWYADRIGKVFEVEDRLVETAGGLGYRVVNEHKSIDREDCFVLASIGTEKTSDIKVQKKETPMFKKGDKVVLNHYFFGLEKGKEYTINSVPGMQEYDKQGFYTASEGVTVVKTDDSRGFYWVPASFLTLVEPIFRKGDIVVHKNDSSCMPTRYTVESVPGDPEYDKMDFRDANKGFELVERGWEYMENYVLVARPEPKPQKLVPTFKKGDVIAKIDDKPFCGSPEKFIVVSVPGDPEYDEYHFSNASAGLIYSPDGRNESGHWGHRESFRLLEPAKPPFKNLFKVGDMVQMKKYGPYYQEGEIAQVKYLPGAPEYDKYFKAEKEGMIVYGPERGYEKNLVWTNQTDWKPVDTFKNGDTIAFAEGKEGFNPGDKATVVFTVDDKFFQDQAFTLHDRDSVIVASDRNGFAKGLTVVFTKYLTLVNRPGWLDESK